MNYINIHKNEFNIHFHTQKTKWVFAKSYDSGSRKRGTRDTIHKIQIQNLANYTALVFVLVRRLTDFSCSIALGRSPWN